MNAKENNVRDMLIEMGKIYKNLPESDLKKEYGQFMLMLSSGSVPLNMILNSLDKRIHNAMEARNASSTELSKTKVSFWKKVRELIVDTYKENKEM